MFKFNYVTRFRQLAAENGVLGKPFGRMVISALVFLVGYILLLVGLARLVATSWGWNANLFLVGLGAVHVALGIMAVTASTESADGPGERPFIERPFVGPDPSETAFERADTLVMEIPAGHDTVPGTLRPPAFPPRTRMSS
jgi:hypothetical protein